MAGEQLLLDPTAEATGTQLDITDGTLGYYLLEHNYPDPDIEVSYATSIDTEGSRPAASKPQNITITAKIRCLQPSGGSPSIGTIVKALQLKIGKMRREGGTYRRVLPSGDTITFDVLKDGQHRIKVPSDKRWVTRQAADIELAFECSPYGRGAEIDLGDNVETTLPVLVFTDSGVKGSAPGLGRLVLDLDSGPNLQLVAWGIQSRYYSSAATAGLFFEAESLTVVDGALNAGAAGASGGGANKVVRQTNAGIGKNSFTGPTGASIWTHVGTFSVWVRVLASNANTGTISIWIEWEPQIGSRVTNAAVAIADSTGAPVENQWCWVNLGLVTMPPAKTGAQGWQAFFNCNGTVVGDQIDWDCVAFLPVDEGYAEMVDDPGVQPTVGLNSARIAHDSALLVAANNGAGVFWRRPAIYEGDYLTIPPAGVEGRTVRMIVLTATLADGDIFLANAIPDISAQLFYTAPLPRRP
jgi:hypothetical protein